MAVKGNSAHLNGSLNLIMVRQLPSQKVWGVEIHPSQGRTVNPTLNVTHIPASSHATHTSWNVRMLVYIRGRFLQPI